MAVTRFCAMSALSPLKVFLFKDPLACQLKWHLPLLPPTLTGSSSHIDLKCSADLLVREKMVKDYKGTLKFIPFYSLFSFAACPFLFSLFPKKGKTCSPLPVMICVADLWGATRNILSH